jgi:hypothetical protein
MKIEKDYEPLDLKNVMFKNYTEQTQNLKDKLNNIIIDFSMIHSLVGEKTLLEQSFQDTKKQILEYHG